jgi:hypothetical protein
MIISPTSISDSRLKSLLFENESLSLLQDVPFLNSQFHEDRVHL